MKNELVKEFQTRIVNAGRSELLIINYEMLLAQLDDAIGATASENKEEFSRSMINARKLLNELSSGLDFKYDIANELMSIYIYVNKKFVDATLSRKAKDLIEAQKILSVLLEGWKLTEYEEEEPIVTNGQKVYAGLTYGRKDVNEMVESNPSRGYRA